MTEFLKISIVTPERKLVEGLQAQSLILPTSEGQIEILPGHASMIGSLEAGVFIYKGESGAEESGALSAGFFEVHNDTVKVLAEVIELKGEIDFGRAKSAQAKAESALTAADLDEHKFKKYQLKLQRSIVRQQLGG